jgi:hypothetical protein
LRTNCSASPQTISRLVAFGGGGVDLGARLVVGDQQDQADAGRERGLAVLARLLEVGGAEAPQPGRRPHPAEDRADLERWNGESSKASALRAHLPL